MCINNVKTPKTIIMNASEDTLRKMIFGENYYDENKTKVINEMNKQELINFVFNTNCAGCVNEFIDEKNMEANISKCDIHTDCETCFNLPLVVH